MSTQTKIACRSCWSRGLRVLLGVLALCWFATACVGEDEACGSGFKLEEGSCVPDNSDVQGADSAAGTDTAGSDAASDAATIEDASTALPSGMGDACTSDAECAQEANWCAYNPMSGSGYCTTKDCTLEPNDCPEGYRCYDFSKMMASLPQACVTEEDYNAMP